MALRGRAPGWVDRSIAAVALWQRPTPAPIEPARTPSAVLASSPSDPGELARLLADPEVVAPPGWSDVADEPRVGGKGRAAARRKFAELVPQDGRLAARVLARLAAERAIAVLNLSWARVLGGRLDTPARLRLRPGRRPTAGRRHHGPGERVHRRASPARAGRDAHHATGRRPRRRAAGERAGRSATCTGSRRNSTSRWTDSTAALAAWIAAGLAVLRPSPQATPLPREAFVESDVLELSDPRDVLPVVGPGDPRGGRGAARRPGAGTAAGRARGRRPRVRPGACGASCGVRQESRAGTLKRRLGLRAPSCARPQRPSVHSEAQQDRSKRGTARLRPRFQSASWPVVHPAGDVAATVRTPRGPRPDHASRTMARADSCTIVAPPDPPSTFSPGR